MYWRLSSCSARSSAERSKMRASESPMSFSAFLIVSVSNSLLPANESVLAAAVCHDPPVEAPPPLNARTPCSVSIVPPSL